MNQYFLLDWINTNSHRTDIWKNIPWEKVTTQMLITPQAKGEKRANKTLIAEGSTVMHTVAAADTELNAWGHIPEKLLSAVIFEIKNLQKQLPLHFGLPPKDSKFWHHINPELLNQKDENGKTPLENIKNKDRMLLNIPEIILSSNNQAILFLLYTNQDPAPIFEKIRQKHAPLLYETLKLLKSSIKGDEGVEKRWEKEQEKTSQVVKKMYIVNTKITTALKEISIPENLK
jgi:hypothetical protein